MSDVEVPYRVAERRPGTPQFVVQAAPQLEWLSLLRIPLGVILLVGVIAALFVLEHLVLPSWMTPDAFAARLLGGMNFMFAIVSTGWVLRRIRSHAKRTRVLLSRDEVRVVAPNGVEQVFQNAAIEPSTHLGSLRVRENGRLHVLPRFVEPAPGAPISKAFEQNASQPLVLAVRNGRIVLATQNGDVVRPIPFESDDFPTDEAAPRSR